MNVRILTGSDAEVAQRLRLEALRTSPTAFGSSEADERDTPIEQIRKRLDEGPPDNATFGAFLDGELVGTVGIHRPTQPKTRHKALVWGMYVAPAARGQSVSKAMMRALIDHARTLDGLEELRLAVTVGNEAARRAYVGFGFETYMVEPRYFKIDGVYYDIEWMWLAV